MNKIFSLTRDPKDSCKISLIGDIDVASSDGFKDEIIPIAESSTWDLRIDCEGLKYIDSVGLSVLVKVFKIMKQKDLKIRLLNVNANIRKLLKLTCLDNAFNVLA